jgi:predicted nucleotidyltransferase
MYETIVGSVAYGVADELSDYDVNGFFIPAADRLFPHLRGQLLGFDKDPKAPKAFQEHHIIDGGREYDLNIYSITVYFRLCLDNNPNMMDTLYTPRECVLHSTPISEMVRERRDIFFHKKCWAKYKGYAYSQFHKMRGRNPEPGSKRHQLREQYGFDVKHAYHTVRLLLECEMILNEHTIDIQRHRSYLKAIRRGEVPQESIEVWYTAREQSLEKAYAESTLRAEPARNEVKQLLLDCLEHHYGSLGALQTVRNESNPERAALHEIQGVIERTLQ